MCSIPGLPIPGSQVTVLITRVNLNPICSLVELWGNFDQERQHAYQQMRRGVQIPRQRFCESEGNPGDLCLAHLNVTWHRARIISRHGHHYNVFLIDEGRAHVATNNTLAWGQNDCFLLPPEVEFCVLANVSPLSHENKWTPTASDFLESLCGKTVNGMVQDVLMPDRTVLLYIPIINKHMYEVGFARKLPSDKFKQLVLSSLNFPKSQVSSTETLPPTVSHKRTDAGREIEKFQQFFYPELLTDFIETVEVTEVINPQRIFCKLSIFSQELKKLSEQINEYYEGRSTFCKARRTASGAPCAVRGSNGKWYRSLLQQDIGSESAVEVLLVDNGKTDFVHVADIRPLAAKFFRMPVVTYVCSLHGIEDRGIGWTVDEIKYLKYVLLHKTVIAKFEYHNLSEGINCVTLYGDDNININKLFGVKERCLLESERPRPRDIQNSVHPLTTPHFPSATETVLNEHWFQVGITLEVKVSCIESPAKFWCQMAQEIKAPAPLKSPPLSSAPPDTENFSLHNIEVGGKEKVWITSAKSVAHFYGQLERNSHVNDKLTKDLQHFCHQPLQSTNCSQSLETVCFAKYTDNQWYRGQIKATHPTLEVHFVDYGDTVTLSQSDILPCPVEAVSLMSVPVQAVPFGLFAVAKDSGGKLLVELYDGTTHINEMVREKLKEARPGKEIILVQSPSLSSKLSTTSRCTDQFQTKCNLPECVPMPTSQDWAARGTVIKHISTAMYLPSRPLKPGLVTEVYVSHCNSHSSFFIQLTKDEDDIFSLVEKLNGSQSSCDATPVDLNELQLGDLVNADPCLAFFAEDNQWYRAQIIHKTNDLFTVLFVDYGNESEVDLKAIRSIPPPLLESAPQAFLCSLAGVEHPEGAWDNNTVDEFYQRIVDKPLKVTVQKMNNNLESLPPQYQVKVECEEHVINDLMRSYLHCSNLHVHSKTECADELFSSDMTISNETMNRSEYKCLTQEITPKLNSTEVPVMDRSPSTTQCSGDTLASVPKLETLPKRSIKPGWVADVYVSQCNSPSSFFVQLVEDEKYLFSLVESLNSDQSDGVALKNVANPQPGDLVNSEFPDDCSWYRAVILETNGEDKINVQYIDFGNEASISTLKVCRLDTQFLEHPRFSIHCSLSGLADTKYKGLEQEISCQFKKVAGADSARKWECKFIKDTGSTWEVYSLNMCCSAGDSTLLDRQSPSSGSLPSQIERSDREHNTLLQFWKLDIFLGQTLDVYASSIAGPGYFWCQYANSEELAEISKVCQLIGNSEHKDTVLMSTLSPGSLCLALFAEDEQWYRAQIVSKMDVISVVFVDYGNESETDLKSLKSVPPQLLEHPPQAFLCSLAEFENSEGSWDDNALDGFYELLADKPLKVTVQNMDNNNKLPIPQYQVKVECEKLIVNDFMKTCWRSSPTESQSEEAANHCNCQLEETDD
ncbi:unnamed protein product [Oncorhynchus mykiss]|uniref:Tudor domain-containing protein n=1 Tax=Oncorhynchus mykiss TaxID=8022 RepID=A0A060WQX4_ONCMY|nr:unnamed protein product [Oncorhynchus mykiss]